VLDPPELVDTGARAARRVLARYRSSDNMKDHET